MRPSLPRVPRGVALLLAVVVIAAATVYSVAWMYYAGREPVGAPRRESSSIARRRAICCWSVSSRALRPSVQACRPATGSSRSTAGGSIRRTCSTMRSPADGRAIASPCESSGTDRSFTTQATLEARPPNPPQPAPRVFVLSLLRFYPAAFLIVAAAVLLQRPQDRTAWLLATLFIVLIAAAPIDGDLIHPAMRPFAFGFKMLGGLLPAAVFFFFAVFPTRSPIDLRAPWLKHVLLWPAVAVIAVLVVIAGGAESLAPIRRVTEWAAWPVLGPVIILLLDRYDQSRSRIAGAQRSPRTDAGIAAADARPRLGNGPRPHTDFDPPDGRGLTRRRSVRGPVPFWIWATCVLALFLIPMSFAYAVVRYRVLEIPVLLKRSARYLLVQRGFVVLLFLLSAGATIVLAIELPFVLPARWHPAGSDRARRGAGLGVALAWGGSRLHRRFTERIDRAFFRNASTREGSSSIWPSGPGVRPDARSSLPRWRGR